MTNTICNTDDIIDIRDVIARVGELEEKMVTADGGCGLSAGDVDSSDNEENELAALLSLMEQCKGNGGDEEWRGDWYPITLIRDSYFDEAMDDLVEQIGDMPKDLQLYDH